MMHLHDWEKIDFHHTEDDEGIPRRVCLKCGKVQLRDPYYEIWRSEALVLADIAERKARQEKAKSLVAKHGMRKS